MHITTLTRLKKKLSFLLVLVLAVPVFSACSSGQGMFVSDFSDPLSEEEETSPRYLIAVDEDADTVDFQCTSIFYTAALNSFNRLVEMGKDENGNEQILPSLAKSWEVSDDRRTYTFHLNEDVTFSNGRPLTSSDVEYTFTRLLTHPDSCNKDIVESIEGADLLESGGSDHLEGFQVLSDLDFAITLKEPFEAFLACLSMPGASILDAETTEEAGGRFGTDPAWTIGTGPFVMEEWIPGKSMSFSANPNCFAGAPLSDGLDLRFMTDPVEIRLLYEKGELDILDLDDLGDSAEFFIHGDIYQDKLYKFQQVGITYIALNESIGPLKDVRIRKALQMALNRELLLDAVYSGRGQLENGIFPYGLYGYNPDLPEIPFDPEEAKKLLAEAGFPDGFDLTVSVKASSTQWELILMTLAASMWDKIGIRANIKVLSESEFMTLRKNGSLACYAATWIADYNDPDNFIYTFFGNRGNTRFRSLCYPNEDIMQRVRDARGIADPDERLSEYHDLEQIIIQEDAAWIPLFSRDRYYVTSDRVEGFDATWNGSVKTIYKNFSIKTEDQQP